MATYDYSGHEETQDPAQLSQLSALADQLDRIERECDEIELQLKEAQERARQLREKDIPDLMMSVGVKKLTTTGGLELDLKEEVRVSFFAKDPIRREPAYAWLEQNNHSGLIKNEVKLKFNKEQEEQAKAIVEHLREFDSSLNVELKKDINHQTLAAFLREQLREHPGAVPLHLFNAFVQQFVKIKRK